MGQVARAAVIRRRKGRRNEAKSFNIVKRVSLVAAVRIAFSS
jgi:hypothetical protein